MLIKILNYLDNIIKNKYYIIFNLMNIKNK